MAAIASTQVTSVVGFGRYVGGQAPHTVTENRIKITGVTAADTATADVLGLSKITGAHSAIYEGSPNVPLLVGIDLGANGLVVGAGPANVTIHVTVVGVPQLRRA